MEPGRCRHNFDCNTEKTRRVGVCDKSWCQCRCSFQPPFSFFHYLLFLLFAYVIMMLLVAYSIDPDGATELIPSSILGGASRCSLRYWSRGRFCTTDEQCADEPGRGYCWRGVGDTLHLGRFKKNTIHSLLMLY